MSRRRSGSLATEAARARCRALLAMIQVAETDAERLGATTEGLRADLAEVAERANLRDLNSLQQQLLANLEGVESAVRGARRAAVRAHLLAAHQVATTGRMTPPAQSSAVAAGERSRAAVEESLARGLERVATVDDAPRRALLALADRVRAKLAADDVAAADSALLTLQSETERAVRRQRVLERVRLEAGRLVARTSDLTGPEVDALHSRALSCRTPAELDEVVEHAHALRAADDAERDRLYVIAQTRSALRELGYEVGEEFSELAQSGAAAVIRRPDLPDHGLRIRFAPSDGRVVTNVVAFGDTSAQRDAEVEELTCADLALVQEEWSSRGIGSTLVSHRAAGERPVERVDAARSRRSQSAAKDWTR